MILNIYIYLYLYIYDICVGPYEVINCDISLSILIWFWIYIFIFIFMYIWYIYVGPFEVINCDISICLNYSYSTNATIFRSRICILCIGWYVKQHRMGGDMSGSSSAQWAYFVLSLRMSICQLQIQFFNAIIQVQKFRLKIVCCHASLHIQVKQENKKRLIIHNSAKV